VADQNRKINWPDPSIALKVNITDIIVIHAVRDEERTRDRDRSEHEDTVQVDPFPAYAIIPEQKQYRCSCVQYRVERSE
jgi:hypothetical protein